MDHLILDAVEKLENDRSEVGNNVKVFLSEKILEYIKKTKKYSLNSETSCKNHEL